jgi:hypothetical protein
MVDHNRFVSTYEGVRVLIITIMVYYNIVTLKNHIMMYNKAKLNSVGTHDTSGSKTGF